MVEGALQRLEIIPEDAGMGEITVVTHLEPYRWTDLLIEYDQGPGNSLLSNWDCRPTS